MLDKLDFACVFFKRTATIANNQGFLTAPLDVDSGLYILKEPTRPKPLITNDQGDYIANPIKWAPAFAAPATTPLARKRAYRMLQRAKVANQFLVRMRQRNQRVIEDYETDSSDDDEPPPSILDPVPGHAFLGLALAAEAAMDKDRPLGRSR